MSGISPDDINYLFSLASSRLKRYQDMLSCERLLSIGLEKNRSVGSSPDTRTHKLKECLEQIKTLDLAYANVLCSIEDCELKSALSAGVPQGDFPEFSLLFSILQEEKAVIDKISLLNKQSFEKAAQLSNEYKDKIIAVQQRKKFHTQYNVRRTLKAGSLFSYTEGTKK